MKKLQTPPVRRPTSEMPARPVRVPIVDYKVHYRINGMRATWIISARDRTTALLNMKELVPGCHVTLLERMDEWS